jgi:hypothetical protein
MTNNVSAKVHRTAGQLSLPFTAVRRETMMQSTIAPQAIQSGLRRRLSGPIVAGLSAAFLFGIAEGAVSYAHRSPVMKPHVSGTNAITVHVVLAAVAALVVIVIQVRRSRRHLQGTPSPWAAPFSATAWARVRRTLRLADGASVQNLARIIVMVALALLALYAPWRIGAEITGGLDPNATVNAWGGPTYAGALLAHSLDAVVGFYAVSFLLGRLLAPARPKITQP